ncbi:TPA: tyrosine-type recombinase/integrase [Enterobacter hormaechei]|uniref:tyrosine-type recombinase/integrase n=1 Tax=Enterobacter hormaechei TaxID=158836 RepID=UPI0006495FCC|nr:tyrosine-type recombinase/integrase [Enterobacter hormaechei]HAV1775813.1 tyrosine-type recombinase/integrase [Enterobacter hormaechei subsp. xiangfangensis]KLP69157.1 integrase [Enterobacter hormaechei subsp. steigerwaltii]MCE1434208.1 tyrosine-type recombinase/integrase [Enterobacter hormaechei]MDL0040936.1 tyrosine-type recombinase/integrase [Enterobacter hormaechei]HCR0303337.1 tyrosine-type recombinase/integrase [Enterobacter hormaechei]
MSLMHDDQPELFPSPAVIPPGEDFLPALSGEGAPVSPARAYLLSLNSPRSRQTMASFLNIVAGMLGAASLESCSWGSLRRHHVMAVTELLRDTGRATATVNTYLSALKGVAKEAWMLRLMDVESFQHIRAVRNLRGSRLPRGRALPAEEIRKLFAVCDADRSSLGPRDAAMLAVILGCGLRRSEAVGLDLRDVVTQDRALRVLGKGNKERLAYMPAGTWERLHMWIDQVRGEHPGPLFTRIRRFDTLTNDRLTDQAVYHILQVRQKLAGIEKCAPHDLRRTFATAMLDNGEDLITVRDAMGHASVTTTQQYDRRGEARLRTARDRLDLT